MLILYGDGMQSFSPKSNKHECITNNQLPAMSIRDIILGFDRMFLDITTRSRDTIHQSRASSDILLDFALVNVKSCAVYTEMYRGSVIVLLHNANLEAAIHCCP